MAEASQSVAPTPSAPEQRNENTSAESNTNDGSSGSPEDEDLQHTQILAHARSVSTPPATPSVTDEIERDITSKDVSEHAPGLYVARSWIRPPGLTGQEVDDILQRLNIDLTLACARIRAKSLRKPRNEDMVMIDMRMAGTPARGSTKVTLKPCIWVFCGSKWCQKIVQRDVKALNWLGPYEVHFVRKGGPLLSADRTCSVGASDDALLVHQSPEACLRDDQTQRIWKASSTSETDANAMSRPPHEYNSDEDHVLVAYSLSSVEYESSLFAAYGSAEVYGYSYRTTTPTNLRGAYEYQGDPEELSATSNYGSYSGYDSASVAGSSVHSNDGEGSGNGWDSSQSRGSAASSVPSRQSHDTDINNTVHQQTPPAQRYQLPCEFAYLTGCDRVFSGDDAQGWMDHIEGHLRGKFPAKLRCWFCSEYYFDAAQTSNRDSRSNFMMRMEHIRDHIVYDGSRPEQITKDGHIVQHLLDHGIIDKHTYDSIVSPTTIPPIPGDRVRRRSRHSRLPQLEIEDADPGPSRRKHHRSAHRRSHHHRSDRDRFPYQTNQNRGRSSKKKGRTKNSDDTQSFTSTSSDNPSQVLATQMNQNRGGSPKKNSRTRDSDDAESFASLSSDNPSQVLATQSNQTSFKGKGRSRDADYVLQSFEALSLSDPDPHVPRSDYYYGPSYADAYGSSYEPAYTGDDYYALAAQSSHDPIPSSSATYGSTGVYGNSYPTTATGSAGVSNYPTDLSGSKRTMSLIGLDCISSISKGGIELGRSRSKMGGAIVITFEGRASLYGVTTGHGLIHQLMDVAPRRLSQHYTAVDWLSESSDSESEDGDDVADFRAQGGYSGNRMSSGSAVDLRDQGKWATIVRDIRANFNGIDFFPASQSKAQPAESHVEDMLSGDLALFPIDSLHRPGLTNNYTKLAGRSPLLKVVTSILEKDVESALPLEILLGPEQTVSGTLLPGKFHFSMRGTAIDTRQIRLSKDLRKFQISTTGR